MSVKRTLPRSTDSRMEALTAAKQKKDSVAPANLPLTASTVARLDVIQPKFLAARKLLNNKKVESTLATAQKNVLLNKQYMYNSHYLQVFNMQIEEGIYPKEYRRFFGIEVNSTSLPNMNSEADILRVTQQIVDGEAAVITAGGKANPFPTLAVLKTNQTALLSKIDEQSNKKDATNQAEEALALLNNEADAVIKKVWDETETFWNEQPIESMRRNCREWGVVYISTEKLCTLLGTVVDKATQKPIDAASITIVSSDEAITTNVEGRFELVTGTEGSQIIRIEKAGYKTTDLTLTLELGKTQNLGTILLEAI